MIQENEFDRLQDAANACKYSSLRYAGYEDCEKVNVLCDSEELIMLMDRSKEPVFLHFAADDFDKVIEQINQVNEPLRINFVPHEHAQKLADIGFEIWGEYIDYFNKNLKAVPIGSCSYEEIELLRIEECGIVSFLSKKCEGLSRGFGSETVEWFTEWIIEDDVLIVRDNGKIVGFCCVAIYSEGTTLWIREIAVAPEYQGKGYGKKLMEQAIGYGIQKGAVKGFLAVDALNVNAIHIYEKYGFAARGGESELQMVRR